MYMIGPGRDGAIVAQVQRHYTGEAEPDDQAGPDLLDDTGITFPAGHPLRHGRRATTGGGQLRSSTAGGNSSVRTTRHRACYTVDEPCPFCLSRAIEGKP